MSSNKVVKGQDVHYNTLHFDAIALEKGAVSFTIETRDALFRHLSNAVLTHYKPLKSCYFALICRSKMLLAVFT
jgi:hypothetical protein